MPVLVAALGALVVIVAGEIDVSVGSVFAICAVAAGLAAKAGLPAAAVVFAVLCGGAALGALNGTLIACARAVDRRHAGDDDRAARRVAMDD